MRLFDFNIYSAKVNFFMKSVWTDHDMSHNTYRHFGFLSSRHYGGTSVRRIDKNTVVKPTTYGFGVDLICVRLWFSITFNTEIKFEDNKKKQKFKKTYHELEIYS